MESLDEDVDQLVLIHGFSEECQLSLSELKESDVGLQIRVAIFLHGGSVEFQAQRADLVQCGDDQGGGNFFEKGFDTPSLDVSDFHENVVME